MQWKFWQEPNPQELSAIVKGVLISQFHLASQSVGKLRFLGRPGRIGDKASSTPPDFRYRFLPGGVSFGL